MNRLSSIKKFMFILCAVFLLTLLSGSLAYADDDGRYRAIVLHEGGSSSSGGSLTPKVFIIDSKDGHMWTWERNMPLIGTGTPGFGSLVTYQGRVKPGKKIGEIIGQGGDSP